jgi:gliding motility-associated-like protein
MPWQTSGSLGLTNTFELNYYIDGALQYCEGDSIHLRVNDVQLQPYWRCTNLASGQVVYFGNRNHLDAVLPFGQWDVAAYVKQYGLYDIYRVPVTVFPPTLYHLPTPQGACADSLRVTYPLPTWAFSISWSDGSNLPDRLLAPGRYAYTVTSLCDTITDSLVVFRWPKGGTNLPHIAKHCGPFWLQSNNLPPYVVNWNNGLSGDSIWVTKSGTYIAHVMTPCGLKKDTAQVWVQSLPTVDLGIDTPWCNVSWQGIVVHGTESWQLLWSDGSTDSVHAASPGLLWLTATNTCGTASDTLMLFTCPYLPTAFTPNGDGLNDVYTLQADSWPDYHLRIWDRWGNLQFESTDPAKGWFGKEAPDGIYTAQLHYRGKDYVQGFSLIR